MWRKKSTRSWECLKTLGLLSYFSFGSSSLMKVKRSIPCACSSTRQRHCSSLVVVTSLLRLVGKEVAAYCALSFSAKGPDCGIPAIIFSILLSLRTWSILLPFCITFSRSKVLSIYFLPEAVCLTKSTLVSVPYLQHLMGTKSVNGQSFWGFWSAEFIWILNLIKICLSSMIISKF